MKERMCTQLKEFASLPGVSGLEQGHVCELTKTVWSESTVQGDVGKSTVHNSPKEELDFIRLD